MSNFAWAVLENIVIFIVIGATTVGVYAFGGGAYGLCSLILLCWLNTNYAALRK